MRAAVLIAWTACALWAQPPVQTKWQTQYFFDKDNQDLSIVDFAFPSATRGVAVGVLYSGKGRNESYVALVSSDGGENWSQTAIKEAPRSLFFLNESAGWMVTDGGIWYTEEAGRSWRKLSNPAKGLIFKVAFFDSQHGFAVGANKTVVETRDGGKTWKPLEAAAKPPANPAITAYHEIVLDGKRGIIVGQATPQRRNRDLPDWMDPEAALKRREQPKLVLTLETTNAGETWNPSTAPLLGQVVAIRMAGPAALSVFGYASSFQWPSEVFRLDLTTGRSTRALRAQDRRITDALLFRGPLAFLVAVEPPGKMNTAPIPGKVRILTSTDLEHWSEMDVDYKAVAGRVVLAGPDPRHLWAATDTGMILRLVQEPLQ